MATYASIVAGVKAPTLVPEVEVSKEIKPVVEVSKEIVAEEPIPKMERPAPFDFAKHDCSKLLNALKQEWGQLVFRKVAQVHYQMSNTKMYKYHYEELSESALPSETKIVFEEVSGQKFDPQTYNQKVEHQASFYQGVTHVKSWFGDRFDGTPIEFNSNSFCSFDVERMSFNLIFDKTSDRLIPPRPGSNKTREVGDWVAGLVKVGQNGKLYFNRWFRASDQFVKMYALIFHPTHEMLQRPETEYSHESAEDRTRDWLMRGNRLTTNTVRKINLWHRENGSQPDAMEIAERYWRYRTEKSSRSYVHMYAALVLMAVYNELPREENMPTDRENPRTNAVVYPLSKWDLPEGFVEALRAKYAF